MSTSPCAVSGALMLCTHGMAPSTLNVLPLRRMMVEGKPAATITDTLPMVNIAPFGMCNSLANPEVAAATAAALGVLTPMPCIPVPAGPWKPGSTELVIGGVPALTSGAPPAMCNCAWGGVITITFAGSIKTVAT